MQNKKEIVNILFRNHDNLFKNYQVQRLGLFGSFVRNEQTENSDVDLLVEFQHPVGLFHFIELQDELSETLHRKVDLVTPNAIRNEMKRQIYSEVDWIEGL